MPAEQHTSFDRGFDLGHSDVPPSRPPIIGRKTEPRGIPTTSWKKYVAMAMVLIMVVSAFVMLVPATPVQENAPVEKMPARAQAGEREVTYTISNLGESYVKDSRDIAGARGYHNMTLGLSEWWFMRKSTYGDTVVHNSTPYSIAYNPESAANIYNGVTHIAFGQYSFYRFAIDAKNMTDIATRTGKEPLYIPVLGNLNSDGGTVQLNWHITYFTQADCVAVKAGTSYANTYYGVPAGGGPPPTGKNPNDGWYVEHSGLMTFDPAAAKKFLNLGGPNLINDFNANRTALNTAWASHYMTEGADPGGRYDIYAAYDYDINSGDVIYYLTLDPSSTATSLVLRIWGYTWGGEVLMMRYLDVQGILPNIIPWPEDWYFNATITTTGANIQTRMSAVYHMMAWKDASFFNAAWLIDPQHNDYNDLISTYWWSRFYNYSSTVGWTPLKQQWIPGSNNIGANLGYWVTPTNWNLATGEKLVVKLGNGISQGYVPYKGTVSDVFPAKGGNVLKAAELNTHQVWGELVLGHGYPSTLYSATYYSHASKTLTITGPTSFPRNPNSNPLYAADVDATGSPQIMLDVSRISNYSMTLPSGPYQLNQPYTLTVTAKNFTGATLNGANPNGAWNGTVNLIPSAGITLGATQHLWSVSQGGVWTTTVTFTAGGAQTIRAVDLNSSLDVDDTLLISSGQIIPEFPTLLIPVIGAVALVVAIKRRKE